MKTWGFTFKCEYFGAQAEFPFFVDADTYHDATILADAYVKEKFPSACEQDLATIKFEGLGIDPKDWGKSKRELQEPCSFCNDDTEIGIEEVGPERICELTHTTGRNFQICYSQYVEAEFEFVYCPMCGRKLDSNLMKLHVYEQENSNLRWVHEELWTKEEQADMRVRKVGEVDSANYAYIGMGYYRHIEEG